MALSTFQYCRMLDWLDAFEDLAPHYNANHSCISITFDTEAQKREWIKSEAHCTLYRYAIRCTSLGYFNYLQYEFD